MAAETLTPISWGDKRYHSLNYFLRGKFGRKIFKVPLDAGFSCPNRDGTLSRQGCLFCSPRGSGDFAGQRSLNIEEQFAAVIQMMHRKWPRAEYIIYYQAFTNTYGPPELLRRLYHQALNLPGVVGLAIATRPDCLPEETLKILEETRQLGYLWVELGLQTIHEASAGRFNLGYTAADFADAVGKLNRCGIETCAHLILGLPGESRDEMLASARFVASQAVQGVKLHLMHLMKDTPLASDYTARSFPFLTQEEYVELVVDILELLPPEMVIHRLTGDSPRDKLLGPLWSLKKWEVLNCIDERLAARNTWQGKRWVRE